MIFLTSTPNTSAKKCSEWRVSTPNSLSFLASLWGAGEAAFLDAGKVLFLFEACFLVIKCRFSLFDFESKELPVNVSSLSAFELDLEWFGDPFESCNKCLSIFTENLNILGCG